MESQAVASIDLARSALRYAEAEHHAEDVRPLQLGSFDFDFDATKALFHDEPAGALDAVAQALADVFGTSAARELRFVVHPPDAYAFVTVIPSDLSEPNRAERFQQEAALVAGTPSDEPPHVTASAIHADTHLDVEPVQVLAVSNALHARLATITDRLPHPDIRWMLSTEAAARVLRQTHSATPSSAEMTIDLVAGMYPEHTEFGLLRNGQWYYSHYTNTETPDDAVYNAVALLDRLGIPRSAVKHAGLYGLDVPSDVLTALETVFDVTPEPLRPFDALGLDTAAQRAGAEAGAYAPCIGAVL